MLEHTPLIVALLAFVLIVLIRAAVTYFAARRKWRATSRRCKKARKALAAGNLDAPINVRMFLQKLARARQFLPASGGTTQRQSAPQERMIAHSDALTGLPNRAVLTHLLECLAAADMPGSVMFIGLQGLKKVNDAFGYRAGDQLLRDVGRRLARVGFAREISQLEWGVSSFGEFERRPPADLTLARFAADQFVVLLPGVVDVDHCERHAEGVLQALTLPFDIAGTEFTLSAHLGIARVPIDSHDPSEILCFADLAMVAAKTERKPWRFFCSALSDGAIDRSRLESELRQALDHGDIKLHYQPQVDIQDRTTMRRRGTGALAASAARHDLAGGVHPDRGTGWVDGDARRPCAAQRCAAMRRMAACRAAAPGRDQQHLGGAIRRSAFRARCLGDHRRLWC
ncbi:MAG: diguanylate cyclase [Rhodopseudomonas palustris]|nr:diguanylate cyclase [Rhodopseudomonas palustris]